MYGTFSGMSFSIVAGVAMLVIAFALFASPLLAIFIALIAAIGFVIGMAVLRARSREAEQTDVSQPGSGPAGPRARGRAGRRPSGAPASGEGEIS